MTVDIADLSVSQIDQAYRELEEKRRRSGVARKIEVQLVGDSSSLDRAFGKSSKAGKTWGQHLKSAGKIAGLGIAAGIGIAAVALKKSVDAAKEAELAEGRMRAQLKASGLSWEKHRDHINRTIDAQSKLSALDDEELSDSFTNLVRVTGDVNKALRLNALATDFARAKGIPAAKAGELIGKVAGGNLGIFDRYGITLKKGATAQEALGVLQKKFAGQAKAYGDSTAGAQEKFGVALENLQEKIGKKLFPVLLRLANWGIQFIGWAETNWPKFSAAVTDAIDRVRPTFDRLIGFWNSELLPAIQNIVAFARTFWGKFGEDIRRVFTSVVSIIRNLMNVAKGIIQLVLALIRGDWSAAWAALKSIAKNAMQALLTYLRAVVTNFLNAGKAIGNAIKDGIMAGVRALAGLLSSAVRGAINAVISAIRGFGIPGFKIDPPGPGSFSFGGVHPFAGIPSLATGGQIRSSGLAMVHRGETVVPARASTGGPGQFALIYAGPDFISYLRNEATRWERTNGKAAFG